MAKRLLIFAVIIFIFNFPLRLISDWTVTILDDEGIKKVYDEKFSIHSITIEQIMATEVIKHDNRTILLVFHRNKQNNFESINQTNITRPMFRWSVSGSSSSFDIMLEKEPVSILLDAFHNDSSIIYGFINEPKAERVLVGSLKDNTSFKDATVKNVELTDGRTTRLYYLAPLDIEREEIKIVLMDLESNEIYAEEYSDQW